MSLRHLWPPDQEVLSEWGRQILSARLVCSQTRRRLSWEPVRVQTVQVRVLSPDSRPVSHLHWQVHQRLQRLLLQTILQHRARVQLQVTHHQPITTRVLLILTNHRLDMFISQKNDIFAIILQCVVINQLICIIISWNSQSPSCCRSYSFLPETRDGSSKCLLSGDTQQSAGSNAFQLSTGALYAEKECERRQGRPVSSNQFGTQFGFDTRDQRPILDNVLSQQQLEDELPGRPINNDQSEANA